MSKPFVTQFDLTLAEKLREELLDKGFALTTPEYTLFSGKGKGVSCTLYTSGKLVVQGKEAQPFIEFYLEPELLGVAQLNVKPTTDRSQRIGLDESGKGDFFGPLCVAGVCAGGEQIAQLEALGVCDSKALSDPVIMTLAPKIKALCAHHVISISPERYNELYRGFGNLNHLLAWAHATVVEELVLKTQCTNVILDQFARSEDVMLRALRNKKIQVALTQRHRGEEDTAVAAASILARYAFVNGLQNLSRQYEITLPKGAASIVITVGKQLVRKLGREALEKVSKTHFKTTEAIGI